MILKYKTPKGKILIAEFEKAQGLNSYYPVSIQKDTNGNSYRLVDKFMTIVIPKKNILENKP